MAGRTLTPPVVPLDWSPSHRVIPSRFSEAGTVLADLCDSDRELEDLIELDGATNDRIQGEQHGLAGISTYELVYGVPNAHIINAAFTHTSDEGCRFNNGTRGAWYASDELDTSFAEVTYHKARRLADIVVPDSLWGRPPQEISTYDDWQADFRSDFHNLKPASRFTRYLQPEPVPQCYLPSQEFARQLLEHGSNGILYSSVRRRGGLCLACFRPALVYRPRQAARYVIRFTALAKGYKHEVRPVELK
jgi:hypothetical protein